MHSSGLAAATATSPPLRMVPAPATLPAARIVERLNAAQPPALIGHATKLAELAREQSAGRLRLRLRAVTSISETLTAEDREAISAAFGVPVIDMFVSTEGLAGHSEPGGGVFTFTSDTCLAECVDDAGRPVPDGTASARVLVTNLHNLTQPLIRYELTDRFTPAAASAGGLLRASVEGRNDDIFRYGTTSVHPSALATPLLRAAQVREYQVRQTARGADITVVAGAGLDEAALAATVEQSLRQAGVTQPHVTIMRAETITRDPRTGKVRRFIPSQREESGMAEAGRILIVGGGIAGLSLAIALHRNGRRREPDLRFLYGTREGGAETAEPGELRAMREGALQAEDP